MRSFPPIHAVLSATLLLLSFLPEVNSEIRDFGGVLAPFSFFVHYSMGYLQTPGSVDLSNLEFAVPFKDGYTPNTTTVDIALFHEPASCSLKGCDWTTLGVGNKNNGGVQWCCTAEAIEYGRCPSSDMGRLIINTTLYKGDIRGLIVPGAGKVEKGLKLSDPKIDVKEKSGKYVTIFANCNDMGREVLVSGSYALESVHGYLPADMFGEWHYFIVVLCGYIVLAAWYGYTMKQYYPDSYIAIQKWILMTILLGLGEALFRALDYAIWNVAGRRSLGGAFLYMGIAFGVSKHTFARCLLVMVSLGWGVTCDQIVDYVMRRIRILGIVYLVVATAADVVGVIALTKEQSTFMSTSQEIEWLGAAAILALVLVGLNILYFIWILAAMTKTMTLLSNSHQNRKLIRYRQLRTLMLAFSAYAIAWFILMRSELLYKFLEPTQAWIVAVLMEVDYLIMITGVAILWRPNEHARDYAYDMQLPVGDDDGHELELTEDVVPSAAAEDNDYSQFTESTVIADPPLQVEDGVTT